MSDKQRFMIMGMDMLLQKFNILPDDTLVSVAELIQASNEAYEEILQDSQEKRGL